jgi:hypothetical protein
VVQAQGKGARQQPRGTAFIEQGRKTPVRALQAAAAEVQIFPRVCHDLAGEMWLNTNLF